jgi:AsmA protein
MKTLKITGATLAAITLVLALLFVIGIPAGFLTSAIPDRIERDTGYHLTIAGATRFSLWPSPNVTLNDVTLDNPNDRERSTRLTAGSIQAEVTLASLWTRRPHISELVIVRPVMAVPLLRERTPAQPASTKPAAAAGDEKANTPSIDRVTIKDGAMVFSNARDRVENRIDGIDAKILIGEDHEIKADGSARAGERKLTFAIKAAIPAPPVERQNIPIEVRLEAPELLQAPLFGKAELRLNGRLVTINGITGSVGDGAFNGWASVDLSSKPLIKLDLDFQRLDVATAKAAGSPSSQSSPSAQTSPPWSDATIDLTGLNYVDAQLRISAAELRLGDARFAPVAAEATLDAGVLKCRFSNLGTYGGQASGDLTVDATAGVANYALSADLAGVRALPLLRGLADFDKLDGRLQAKIGVRSTGASQRAIVGNLAGSVSANFQDGAIRGLNVAQMIRALTANPLSGWQQNEAQTTDLSQLSASFRIENGHAATSDLTLVGPLVKMTGAGSIDLPQKSLALRVEPKLVMTTQGQGRSSDPAGLGIPVVIDGPWAGPRIYPDVAGVLDNPDAAYAKLKEMGKGLFGSGGLGGSDGNGSGLGAGGEDLLGTIGNLLQRGLSQGSGGAAGQGSGQRRGGTPPDPAAPPAQTDPPPQQGQPQNRPPQDRQPINDLLRQFFNR